MKFRAIIFDLDGTLLDTLKDLALSVNAVLKKHGYPEHEVEDYRFMVGDGVDVLVKKSLPAKEGTADNVAQLGEEVQEEYRRCWADNTRPYPGISELLTNLEQMSIPKAIFSNKPQEFTTVTVDALLPHWKFVAVKGIEEGVPCKPDPTGVLSIAREINISPGEFVYVGDTNTDMQTAVSAGMYAVGVSWGFRPVEELRECGAKLIVEDPREIELLFK